MQFEELDDLYREIILDHFRNPRNSAKLEAPDLAAEGNNPFCGDEVSLQLRLDGNGLVREVGFQGKGCSISQASASMMTELLKGKTLAEAEVLYQSFRKLMQGQALDEEETEKLGELEALQGVRKFPIRIKCALLAWSILSDGIKKHSALNK